MSHPSASRSSSTASTSASTSRRSAEPQRPSRRAQHHAQNRTQNRIQNRIQNRAAKPAPAQKSFLTPHRRKVLGAGGAITLLAMATILPTQVSSQAIADSNCEQVIKSGAEISRGQLSGLLAMPTRSTREAVRQVVAEPYCTLPAITPAESTGVATPDIKTIEREAYPLAFDPQAWVVLNYSAGEYQGYDFVFKP